MRAERAGARRFGYTPTYVTPAVAAPAAHPAGNPGVNVPVTVVARPVGMDRGGGLPVSGLR